MERADYRLSNYDYLKSIHRCVSCRERDAFTLNGHSYCAKCVERAREYNKKSRQTHSGILEKRKSERQYRRENHLCTICGVPLPKDSPYKMCDKHRAYFRKSKRRENERKKGVQYGFKRQDYGLCYKCGKHVKEGLNSQGKPYKLCERCYQDAMRGLRNAMRAER